MNVSVFFQEVKWQKKIKVKPQKINVTVFTMWSDTAYISSLTEQEEEPKQLKNGRHVLNTQLSF